MDGVVPDQGPSGRSGCLDVSVHLTKAPVTIETCVCVPLDTSEATVEKLQGYSLGRGRG